MVKRVKKKKEETIVYDIENEQIILSQMMRDNAIRKRCVRELTESLFFGKRHKVIFRVLSEIVSRGLDYNKDTFSTIANNEDFGGFQYLIDLEELFDENKNIEFHTQRLKLDAKKINLKKTKIKDLNNALEDPNVSAVDLSKIVKDIEHDIKDVFVTQNILKGKELKNEYYKTLKERQELGRFVGTGFSFDEYLTEGLARKKVSVVGARPSMGKTTFIANLVNNLIENKISVLASPLETGKDSFIDMLVALRTGIPLDMIIKNTKDLTKKQKYLIQKEVSNLLDNEYLHILDDTSVKLSDFRILLESSNYAVWIVDLFEKISDISFEPKILSKQLRDVQNFTKEANVHSCLVSQIKRNDNNKNKNQRPTLELLKNSGSYEEIADLVFLLHREYYYNPELEDDVLEVIIAKQRMGVRNKSFYYPFKGHIAKIGEELVDYSPLTDVF